MGILGGLRLRAVFRGARLPGLGAVHYALRPLFDLSDDHFVEEPTQIGPSSEPEGDGDDDHHRLPIGQLGFSGHGVSDERSRWRPDRFSNGLGKHGCWPCASGAVVGILGEICRPGAILPTTYPTI